MVSLKSLSSFNRFAETVRDAGKDYINALFMGQAPSVNPAANLKAYWSYEDLHIKVEQDLVKKFYGVLGLTTKTKFAQLYTDESGVFDKNNVWLPSISLNPDTGKLALYVGFTAIDIDFDLETGEFLIPTYSDGSNTTVLQNLDVEVRSVKTMTGDEVRRLVFMLTVDDETDDYVEFPIRLNDSNDDRLAKAVKGRKKTQIAKTWELIKECVAVSKISSASDICDINKLLLPVFQNGKTFKPVAVPFTGWIFKSATPTNKYPKIHLSIDTQHIVDDYGDFEVQDFQKNPVKVSKIRKLSLSPTSSGATFFLNQSDKTDIFIPVSGVMMVTAPNKRLDFAPSYIVQLASAMPPELLAKFNLVPPTNQLPGQAHQAAITPKSDPTSQLFGTDDQPTQETEGKITYESLEF